MESLSLLVAQTAPLLCQVASNRTEMEHIVAGADEADLVVFPELALTGYDVGARAGEVAVTLAGEPPLRVPRGGPLVAFGLVERGRDHLVYNSAVLLGDAGVLAHHRKVYLPTYGIFDEGRTFARGREGVGAFELAPGWRAGMLVCEDLWHPALPYLLALQEVDVLLVLAAAPGRGRSEDPERVFASSEKWQLLARAAAFNHGVYVVLVNRAGVEGDFTFAGGSLVVGPDGTILARAPEAEEALLPARLERDAVTRARHPFSHLRDEDPGVTLRELARILEAGPGHDAG